MRHVVLVFTALISTHSALADEYFSVESDSYYTHRGLVLFNERTPVPTEIDDDIDDGCWPRPEETKNVVDLELKRSDRLFVEGTEGELAVHTWLGRPTLKISCLDTKRIATCAL